MPTPSDTRLRVLALACLTGLVLAGCGIVSGVRTTRTVHLRVTSGFGSTTLATGSLPRLSGTVGALGFTRHFTSAVASGRRVESIAGHVASGAERWSLYVNGINAPGPNTQLYDGDHVWWDLRDASAGPAPPAIVGAYPEPFTNGSGGRPFPTVLICANGFNTACHEVTGALDHVGVKVSFQALGTGSGSDSLALEIGTYTQLRDVIATELIAKGPASSGVYAQFAGPGGHVLELDNAAGSTTETLAGSYGLIAATEQVGFSEPVWLITGTDRAGVNAAARALSSAALNDHFAIAVTTAGRIIPLPTG